MALLYRKKVRDAVLGFLTSSFNSTLASVAPTYGIPAFSLDFSPESSVDFAVSHIEPSNIETCRLTSFPAGCLYTSDVVDEGEPHSLSFAGKLFAHIDFYVRDREGAEGFNTEDLFDAIEDAALTVLGNPANVWPPGVLFQRKSEMSREYLIPLGDGFATRIPIKTLFEVFIN
jgi:hypothetical protein